VTVSVTDAATKRAPKLYPLWKSDNFSHCAVLSYELSINTICNALTLALHDVNKRITKCAHN
jgi:hypothetical protein